MPSTDRRTDGRTDGRTDKVNPVYPPPTSLGGGIINADSFVFVINNENLKQGRPGYKPELLRLVSYPDKRLCIVNYLKVYLNKTLDIRQNEKKLFLATNKPHRAAKRDTISRWVKEVLKEAGVDTAVFKAGSTRAAAASKASTAGVPLDEILRAGGWARKSTFQKWYKRDVRKEGGAQMAAKILDSSDKLW